MRSSRAALAALVTVATFTDVLALSICVPVLPDLARRTGASAATIGLLFGSFGATLLAVSVPMGIYSDRIGRRMPLVGGMCALALASIVFARSSTLTWLFAARMIAGAADGATWVAGLALVADLYEPSERGRVMGYVMSGTSFGVMVGPSIGGWLYEAGGIGLPFAVVVLLATGCAVAFWLVCPRRLRSEAHHRLPIGRVVRTPAVLVCTCAVVIVAATLAMMEPVLPLHFADRLGLSPARIGLLFGSAAVASTLMPFLYGPLTDRWGGRRLTFAGLVLTAAWLPTLATASSFRAALLLMIVQWMCISVVITPSLAYMAEAMQWAGSEAYGIGYGVYNAAWALGLLAGPVFGGWLLERVGFGPLVTGWSVVSLLLVGILWRVQSSCTTTGGRTW